MHGDLEELKLEPSAEVKAQRLQASGDCQHYPKLESVFLQLPCTTWKEALASAQSDLIRQGAVAACDAIVAVGLAGVGAAIAPAAGAVTNASARAAASLNAAGSVASAAFAVGGEISTASSLTGVELDFYNSCRSECLTDEDVENCAKHAKSVFDKIVDKHKAVKLASNASTAVSIVAPLVGIAVDVCTVGLTLGGGTATGGLVALGAAGVSATIAAGHLATSCVQHNTILKCWTSICNEVDL